MNLTDQFVDGIYAFSKRNFSENLQMHARKCLLDYLAATIAGAKAYFSVEESFLGLPISTGNESTIIGHKKKSSPAVAALINGISAHAVELDDGQRFGNIHPGAPVISSILAIGEARNQNLNDIYKGILIGYESVLRLACSIQPGHKLKGFHATGPCGTIGATMGIAAMLGFSWEQFKASLSVACTSASGILEMIEGDTQMMPYNAGKAAANAVVAASVGYAGFKTPEDALGGERGFLHCFADNVKRDMLSVFDEELFCTTNYFKPYAACGHCHASIEAALRIRERDAISADDIVKIDIQTYKLAIQGHDHTKIDGVHSARMSIPYSAVVALLRGSAGIEDFSEKVIQDKKILDTVSKVSVVENEKLTVQSPSKRMAIMDVYTSAGLVSEKVDFPKGQPENPMTMDDIINKFYECGRSAGFEDSRLKQIADIVLNNGDHTVLELMNCLSSVN